MPNFVKMPGQIKKFSIQELWKVGIVVNRFRSKFKLYPAKYSNAEITLKSADQLKIMNLSKSGR